MEKQDLDNLQRTTKEYSASGRWLSTIIMGLIFMVYGFMLFFKIGNWGAITILFYVLAAGLIFISKYLNHAVMHKGLGYVKQKEAPVSQKHKFSLKQTLLIMIIPCLVILLLVKLWIQNPGNGVWYPFMILGIGFYDIAMIAGPINRKKEFLNFILYLGVFFGIAALILTSPMKNIFRANEMASLGIWSALLGLWLILSGIINYFQYKKIVQKVKGTN
ncbi:MAG: hypothetical protein PHE49_11095 [bacterium]|nr:hypothetical protein [bacterium]